MADDNNKVDITSLELVDGVVVVVVDVVAVVADAVVVVVDVLGGALKTFFRS